MFAISAIVNFSYNHTIHVREIEYLGLACCVLHGQNGPAYLLPVTNHDDENHKIFILEIIWLYKILEGFSSGNAKISI